MRRIRAAHVRVRSTGFGLVSVGGAAVAAAVRAASGVGDIVKQALHGIHEVRSPVGDTVGIVRIVLLVIDAVAAVFIVFIGVFIQLVKIACSATGRGTYSTQTQK